MFEQTKLFFKNLKQEIAQKFDNFVKTGDFNMKNPSIALSTTEFERFSVQTNVAREEILKEDGVEVVFAPQNVDLECLKHCLKHGGYKDAAIEEVNLKAGILSFLRYSPYLINKHLDMKHGLAYLFRKQSGETYYMILKPETEHGSILLFENHYLIVKNLPAPFRQMQASFKAKIFNFIFGMLIPDLGFNESFLYKDHFFSTEDFEDAEHVDEWLKQLVGKYFGTAFWWMEPEKFEKEREWFRNKKFKANHYLVPTATYYNKIKLFKMLENVSKILTGFEAVKKLKNDRALYEQARICNYSSKREVYPESFYPLSLRLESPIRVNRKAAIDNGRIEIIYVNDIQDEIDFFLPKEDRWLQDGFMYKDMLCFDDREFCFKESLMVLKDDLPLELMKLNRNINYVTKEEYVKDVGLNILLSNKIYAKLYELECPLEIQINKLKFVMLNCCERNLVLDYIRLCQPQLDNILNSNEMITSVYFQEYIAALVKKKKMPEKIKGDVANSFLKPVKFEGTMYQLPGYRILIDQYIYSSDMRPITHMGLTAYIMSCPEALKFLKKKKVNYKLHQKGDETSIYFPKMNLTIIVPIKIEKLIFKPSDLNFCTLSFGELKYWKENDRMLCKNKWFDTVALISHFDRYCCDSKKYRNLVAKGEEFNYFNSTWKGGIF